MGTRELACVTGMAFVRALLISSSLLGLGSPLLPSPGCQSQSGWRSATQEFMPAGDSSPGRVEGFPVALHC